MDGCETDIQMDSSEIDRWMGVSMISYKVIKGKTGNV